MSEDFSKLFGKDKVVMGMIHLSSEKGKYSKENISRRAIHEMEIYQEEGVDGVIVENYHGEIEDIDYTLNEVQKLKEHFGNLKVGVNCLGDIRRGFDFTRTYGSSFIQIDSVVPLAMKLEDYNFLRSENPVVVLGGVEFKYVAPTGNSLEQDLTEGMSRCDSIVTTGEGTGIETPIEKLERYREMMGNFPLIVGAGVTVHNVVEQLKFADGAIIGSYFKHGDTRKEVDRGLVRELMSRVREIR